MTNQQPQIDPQRVIQRLTQQLAEAQLRAAQYGALADQLLEQQTRQYDDGDEGVTPAAT